jgi:glycosyltransferase involved in cell wall biosynthesis
VAPTVSVVVAAYNAEDYIDAALRSALAQTVDDLEVVVVDDCSTDTTPDRVAGIVDSRMRLHRLERRSGPSACRNRAIEDCAGEWIAVLDADDWWHERRLEALLPVARACGADVVCDDLLFARDGDSEPYPTYYQYLADRLPPVTEPRQVSVLEMVRNDYGYLKPVVRAAFLRRSGVRYRPDLRLGEDFAFAVDCLLAGAATFLAPGAYYYYRQSTDSITRHPSYRREFGRHLQNRYRIMADLLAAGGLDPGQRAWLAAARTELTPQVRVEQIQDALAAKQYGLATRLFLTCPRVYHLAPGSLLWRLRGKPDRHLPPGPGSLEHWLSQVPVKPPAAPEPAIPE